MTTYNTKNPLGSSAVKDLFDNAENTDHFSNNRQVRNFPDRFGVPRKTYHGMEKEHDEQMSGQETRFQSFLNSSGYVFLGDYEEGPFQFSARNQYIRYDNQYYRLNASTNVGFTTTGTTAGTWASDVTHFVLMDGDTLRQNLGSSEGAKLVGYGSLSVFDAIYRLRSLLDTGTTIGYLGYNPVADATIWNNRLSDNDVLLPGGLAIARSTHGIRRNATGFSVRINQGANGYNTQVAGVSDSIGLRAYGSVDDVAAFFEGYTEAYAVGEIVNSVTSYSANSVVADIDFSLLKVGMILATMHSSSFWGMVTGWNASTKTISVDKWSSDGSTAGVPVGTTGMYINFKSKTFALNGNVVIDLNSKANHASGFELGMVNNKLTSPTDFNGFDSVSLGNNRGTVAFLARNSKIGNKWQNGFRSTGAEVASFFAAGDNGVNTPRGYVNSGCEQGFVSYGGTVAYHSVVRNGSITGGLRRFIDGIGRVGLQPELTTVIGANATMNNGFYLFIIATVNNITVSVPAQIDKVDGQTYRIKKPYTGGAVTLNSVDGDYLIYQSVTPSASVVLQNVGTYVITWVSSLNLWVVA
ncbi:hypothetical protein ACL2XP_17850 [Sodalis sp. RH21]|uniref:hypothetical protein n=1 Tax=unclassified Sodalis (in: enterobacteria) TaxID=2636512 RepID=UPI0039B4B12F